MSTTEKTESTASKLHSHIAYHVRDREGQKAAPTATLVEQIEW